MASDDNKGEEPAHTLFKNPAFLAMLDDVVDRVTRRRSMHVPHYEDDDLRQQLKAEVWNSVVKGTNFSELMIAQPTSVGLLYKFVENRVKDLQRREFRREETRPRADLTARPRADLTAELDNLPAAEEFSPEKILVVQQTLVEALDRLSPRNHGIVLSLLDGSTSKETAEEFGTSHGNVRVIQSTWRSTMRQRAGLF